MRRIAAMLAVVALSGGAWALADDKAKDKDTELKGDLKTIQGEWNATGPDGQSWKWEFKGETLRAEVGDRTFVCTVKLDDAAKPHKTADFKITEPDEHKGQTALGVYELGDKTLKICVARPDLDERPKQFEAVEDDILLIELKRP